MKTRPEIIQALIAPAHEAAAANIMSSDLASAFADIYDAAGHFDDPDKLSQLIYGARSAELLMPDYAQLFRSIAAVAQDELLTRHRRYVKDAYRLKTEAAHAWLVDYLGSSSLADIIEGEVEREADN